MSDSGVSVIGQCDNTAVTNMIKSLNCGNSLVMSSQLKIVRADVGIKGVGVGDHNCTLISIRGSGNS